MQPWFPALLLLSSAAALAAGDPQRGAALYERCGGCHSLAQDRAGPRHCGLIGRRAGAVKDFPYSDAMKRAPISWDAATLDRFLADPQRVVPGTAMAYSVDDPRERADVIAYLAQANRSPECK
ncbi:MAG TPA: c-type cytochrome [Usitatibacter sp.]|nr:c-type cytochrome [Usitatibacter sp.]